MADFPLRQCDHLVMEPNYQSDIENWLLDNIALVVGFLAAVLLVASGVLYVLWERVGEQSAQIVELETEIFYANGNQNKLETKLETEIAYVNGNQNRLAYRISSLEDRPRSNLRKCITDTLRFIGGDTGDAEFSFWTGETWSSRGDGYHSHFLESGSGFGGASHTHAVAGSLSTPRSCN